MPDAAGNFKGQGWSARKAAAWERVFAKQLDGKCPRPPGTPCYCTGACFNRNRDNLPPTA